MKKLIIFALLLFSITPPKAAEKVRLSRLFTTTAERAKLDGLRQAASVLDLQAQKKEPEAETVIPFPSEISMQGFVKRSDGKKSTLWVNHQAIQENTTNADVQVGSITISLGKDIHSQNAVSLKLLSNGQRFSLKAGQVYLPNENRVLEIEANDRAKQQQVKMYSIEKPKDAP